MRFCLFTTLTAPVFCVLTVVYFWAADKFTVIVNDKPVYWATTKIELFDCTLEELKGYFLMFCFCCTIQWFILDANNPIPHSSVPHSSGSLFHYPDQVGRRASSLDYRKISPRAAFHFFSKCWLNYLKRLFISI